MTLVELQEIVRSADAGIDRLLELRVEAQKRRAETDKRYQERLRELTAENERLKCELFAERERGSLSLVDAERLREAIRNANDALTRAWRSDDMAYIDTQEINWAHRKLAEALEQ